VSQKRELDLADITTGGGKETRKAKELIAKKTNLRKKTSRSGCVSELRKNFFEDVEGIRRGGNGMRTFDEKGSKVC